MDNNIIKIDEENLKNDLKGVIRKTIEETLNTMLDEEAAELVPKLPWPRSRPPSSSATGAGNRPWRSLSSRCTWREYPCAAWKTSRSSCGAGNMFVDGIYLKRSWRSFLVSLRERGLNGVRLFTSDKHLGFLESASEVFPDAKWQRCTVHFFRNLMTKIPRNKLASAMPLLKATYAQEDKEATLKKVANVEQKLCDMGLKSAADLYRKGVMETLTYLDFPHEHWRSIRTNNILERLNREIRRRTRVVGCLQKHPRLGYENMQACFRIVRLAAFSQTGNLP